MRITRSTLAQLCRARERLHDDDAAIPEIAGSISPYHFIRQFEAATPHQYRIAARIERAKQLLACGESEAGKPDRHADVGHGSFSELFARSVGAPPSRYRKLAAPRIALYRGCFELMAFAIFEKRGGAAPSSLPA